MVAEEATIRLTEPVRDGPVAVLQEDVVAAIAVEIARIVPNFVEQSPAEYDVNLAGVGSAGIAARHADK